LSEHEAAAQRAQDEEKLWDPHISVIKKSGITSDQCKLPCKERTNSQCQRGQNYLDNGRAKGERQDSKGTGLQKRRR
jgi:hypothetical protein